MVWQALIPAVLGFASTLFGGNDERVDATKASSSTGFTTEQTERKGTTNVDFAEDSTQMQVQQRLDDQTLTALTQLVRGGLGGQTGRDAVIQSRLDAINNAPAFDPQAYVQGVTENARALLRDEVESGRNNIAGNIGASVGTNSMGALLTDRLSRNAATTLGGISADAAGRAAELQMARQAGDTASTLNLVSRGDSVAISMLESLLNATQRQSTTGKRNTAETQEEASKLQGLRNITETINTSGSEVGSTGTPISRLLSALSSGFSTEF